MGKKLNPELYWEALDRLTQTICEVTLQLYGDYYSELKALQGEEFEPRLFFASERIRAEIMRRFDREIELGLGKPFRAVFRSTVRDVASLIGFGIRSRKQLQATKNAFNGQLDDAVRQVPRFASTLGFVHDLQDAMILPKHLKPRDLITKMLDHFTPEETAPTKARRAVLALLLGQDAVSVIQLNAAQKNIEEWKRLTALSPNPKRIKPEMLIIASAINFRRAFSNPTEAN